MVADDGREEVHEAGDQQRNECKNDGVVYPTGLNRVLGLERALENRHLLERARRLDPSGFQRRQCSPVNIQSKFGLHLQSLVFLDGAIEALVVGRGEPCIFACDLLFDRSDLLVELDYAWAGGHEV